MTILLTPEQKAEILLHYSVNCNVTKLIRDLNLTPSYRRHIEKFLKDECVYEDISSPKSRAARHKAKEDAIYEKYGAKNISQVNNSNGLQERNARTKTQLRVQQSYDQYRKTVEYLTNSYKRKNPIISTRCYYTDIPFVDNQIANPNDPLKSTIDHKIPIAVGFLNNIPAETIAAPDNLVYCLRIVNSIKGTQTAEEFAPLAQKLKEMLLNEIV